MKPRSLQDWVHWLEAGAGGRWVTRAAIVVGVLLLSWRIGYTQFQGPRSEQTLAQAVVARQLAEGHGFSTLVREPQSVAWARERGRAEETFLPELRQAPLYPAIIAATLGILPDTVREKWFSTRPEPPAGFFPDYVLLGVNIALLWLAAAQTYFLARRMFDRETGAIAALALLLSSAIWSETVAVNGVPLTMVLTLALFQVIHRIDGVDTGGKRGWLLAALAGLLAGGLFLTDYPAGVALVAVWGWIGLSARGRSRWVNIAAATLAFLIVAGPWMARNVSLAANPLGLAAQGIALKAGDPTADPAMVRAGFSTEPPKIQLRKLGNKVLTAVQTSMGGQLWSAGGFFLTALFVTGLVYRFRDEQVNRLRWLFVFTLALLTLAHAALDSGEGERLPMAYATPLLMIWGAGFFSVLIASSEVWRQRSRWAAAVLLTVQALPLAQDIAEPRRLHFHFPPYYPGLFIGMGEEMARRAGPLPVWTADVPAGVAWYSGQRVWTQPRTLGEFYGVCQEQPQLALVLTPRTLDRPFFGELMKRENPGMNTTEWADVYAALVTHRFPPAFPLSAPQKVTDNFYVLLNPYAMSRRPLGE